MPSLPQSWQEFIPVCQAPSSTDLLILYCDPRNPLFIYPPEGLVLFGLAGVDSFVVSITLLAAGTSIPSIIGSAVSAHRSEGADSAIACINCRYSNRIQWDWVHMFQA